MWRDIPTLVAKCSEPRNKNRAQHSSPGLSETNRKSPPADDQARNNARLFHGAVAAATWLPRHREFLESPRVARNKKANRQSLRQIRRRPFANETPALTQAFSRDRNQAREFS